METLAFTRGKSIKRSLDIGLAREWPKIIEDCHKILDLRYFDRNILKFGSYDNEDKELVIEFYFKFSNPSVTTIVRTFSIEYNVEKWMISGTVVEMDTAGDPYDIWVGDTPDSPKIFKIEKQFFQCWKPEEMALKFNEIYHSLNHI